jgi:hypothetical protein
MSKHHHRGGHFPGHFRDTFLAAVEAFTSWDSGEPEPTVDFEIDYEPRPILVREACGLLWNCTDILPYRSLQDLRDCGIEIGRQTYAAAAQAMLDAIKKAA